MGSGTEAEEELRTIGTWASISHRKDTTFIVLIDEVFVCEGISVDGLPACAVACSKIATLSHESPNDSVESASCEAETCLTSAELSEVFRGYRSISGEGNSDPTSCLSTNGNVEVDSSVSVFCHIFLFLSFCFKTNYRVSNFQSFKYLT